MGARRGLSRRSEQPRFHVVAYDFGIKRNILRMLAERGCQVTVVPAQTAGAGRAGAEARRRVPVQRPGRSRALRLRDRRDRAKFIDAGMPTVRHLPRPPAAGARRRARRRMKMKFGHHGANHPVQDLDTGRVVITSQNHGFAVDAATLPANAARRRTSRCSTARCRASRAPTGRRSASRAIPEASPGPHDIGYLFDRFIEADGSSARRA